MFKVHEIYDTERQKVIGRYKNLQSAEKHVLRLNNDHKMKIAWEAVNLSSKGGWKRPTIITKTKGEYGNVIKTQAPNPKHKLLVETLDKLKGERYTVNTYDLV
jgi:hypothetical protein